MKIVNCFFALILLAGCTGTGIKKKNGIKGGYIRLAELENSSTCIPHFAKNNADYHVLSQIHAGLVKLNPQNLEPEPCLARKWTIDSTAKTYVIFLRTNAYFHNDSCFGEKLTRKVTAFDVKYTFELIANKSWNPSHFEGSVDEIEGATDFYNKPGKYAGIKGIYVVNDSMLRINLSKSNPYFLHKLAQLNTSILAHEAVEKYGKNCLVGLGPFYVKDNPTGKDSLILYANNNFFISDKNSVAYPFLDSLCFYFGVASREELNLIKSCNIDFIINLSSTYLNEFLEQNIEFFQGSVPLFKITQANDLKDKYLYNLMRSNIQNLHANSQNFLDLSIVYLKEPEPRGEVSDTTP